MDLPTALMHEVGHRPGREHQGVGVPTETVGAGTWRGPGADADLARCVDAFSALHGTRGKRAETAARSAAPVRGADL